MDTPTLEDLKEYYNSLTATEINLYLVKELLAKVDRYLSNVRGGAVGAVLNEPVGLDLEAPKNLKSDS